MLRWWLYSSETGLDYVGRWIVFCIVDRSGVQILSSSISLPAIPLGMVQKFSSGVVMYGSVLFLMGLRCVLISFLCLRGCFFSALQPLRPTLCPLISQRGSIPLRNRSSGRGHSCRIYNIGCVYRYPCKCMSKVPASWTLPNVDSGCDFTIVKTDSSVSGID